ncbi:MAG TPA: cell division protein FtsZ, partial [Streptosporangiaceae bacterium]
SGEPESTRIEAIPAPRPADVPAAASLPGPDVAAGATRADAAVGARIFDPATTRRRSVVFEEDDELDVPDFLK